MRSIFSKDRALNHAKKFLSILNKTEYESNLLLKERRKKKEKEIRKNEHLEKTKREEQIKKNEEEEGKFSYGESHLYWFKQTDK